MRVNNYHETGRRANSPMQGKLPESLRGNLPAHRKAGGLSERDSARGPSRHPCSLRARLGQEAADFSDEILLRRIQLFAAGLLEVALGEGCVVACAMFVAGLIARRKLRSDLRGGRMQRGVLYSLGFGGRLARRRLVEPQAFAAGNRYRRRSSGHRWHGRRGCDGFRWRRGVRIGRAVFMGRHQASVGCGAETTWRGRVNFLSLASGRGGSRRRTRQEEKRYVESRCGAASIVFPSRLARLIQGALRFDRRLYRRGAPAAVPPGRSFRVRSPK